MKYDHDQAMEKIRQEQAHKLDQNVPPNATMPELPVFEDDKDSIDDYLQRFERFARAQNWDKTRYAIILSALLTGKALTVYARLSDNDVLQTMTKSRLPYWRITIWMKRVQTLV